MKIVNKVLFVCIIVFGFSSTHAYATNGEVIEISKKYSNVVDYYTKRFGGKVAPLLVSAIIFVESSGNPRAFNKESKAAGLMGIMTIALKQVRKVYPHERFGSNLFNPDNNIKVGVAYLAYMINEYELKNHEALAVGFSSGPNKGVRYTKKPKKNEYVRRVNKTIRILSS